MTDNLPFLILAALSLSSMMNFMFTGLALSSMPFDFTAKGSKFFLSISLGTGAAVTIFMALLAFAPLTTLVAAVCIGMAVPVVLCCLIWLLDLLMLV